ncbi:dipeptidase [bacterium]|nr:dipeptidase [bacterium]
MIDPIRFHHECVIVDGLNASWFFEDAVFRNLHQSGVTVVNATVAAWQNPAETIDFVGQMYQKLEKHSDIALQVRCMADIETARASSRVGMILGFQDTSPVADQIHLLRVYHELGIRIMQLTYNTENRVGFGCQAPEDKGLTDYGRQVIAEMNRLGILIDLSHCGPRTTMEAIEASAGPVAITHANPASQFPHPRNKSDDIIRALVDKGGVIGALSFPAMITSQLPASIENYLDVIDYLVTLVGVDSVGLGPDFMEHMPPEIEEAALKALPPDMQTLFRNMPPVERFSSIVDLPNVTAGLLKRGYSEADAAKILGQNWIGLYRRVWRN